MSKLSRNILFNFLGQGILLIIGLAAARFIFRGLGGDALGIIYFTLTISNVLFAVLEAGICTTTVREVSARYESERDYICRLTSTATLFYWCSWLLFAAVLYLAAPLLVAKWLQLRTIESGTAVHVVRILGVAAMLTVPRTLYASLIRGLQRMECNNAIDAAAAAIQQGGVILVLALGGGLVQAAWWMAASFGLWTVAYIAVASSFFPARALIPGFHPSAVARNLGYSSRMMSISALSTIHSQIDKLLLNKFLPLAAAGTYTFAYVTMAKATLLTNAVAQAALPHFSSVAAGRPRQEMLAPYQKMQDVVCFGTVPMFAGVLFAVLPVFGYVLDPATAKTLMLPAALLAVGFYMNSSLHVPYMFSLSVGRPDITVRSNFYALFTVLPATALLTYFFGTVGAALSWIVYHVFAYFYVVPRIVSECLGLSVARWYGHVFRFLGLGGGVYGAAWLALEACGTHSALASAVAYAAGSAAYLGIAARMIGPELRTTIWTLLRGGPLPSPSIGE